MELFEPESALRRQTLYPVLASIVRSEARRLRTKLKEYYDLDSSRFPLFRRRESGTAVSAGEVITLTAHQTDSLDAYGHGREWASRRIG
jgi:hypothetical protein